MHTTDVKGKDWLVRRDSVVTGNGKRATKGKGCKNIIYREKYIIYREIKCYYKI